MVAGPSKVPGRNRGKISNVEQGMSNRGSKSTLHFEIQHSLFDIRNSLLLASRNANQPELSSHMPGADTAILWACLIPTMPSHSIP